MQKRWMKCAVILLMGLPLTVSAVETVQVHGHAIKLEPPGGDCAYSAENEKDAAFLAQLQHANAGKRQVLLAFSNCADRDAMRAEKPQATGDYGHAMAPLAGGMEQVSREQYVAQLAHDLTARYGRLESDRAKLKDLLLDSMMEADKVRVLGVMAGGPDLVQTATVENLPAPDKSLRVLGVITDTNLGAPVLIAFYHISKDSEDAAEVLEALSARAADYTRALIRLQSEKDGIASAIRLPFSALGVWFAALILGLAFVRRKRKTHPSIKRNL